MSTVRQTSFTVRGSRIAGVVRTPPGDGPHPGLVLTGPFTGVKEQVVGTYASGSFRAIQVLGCQRAGQWGCGC